MLNGSRILIIILVSLFALLSAGGLLIRKLLGSKAEPRFAKVVLRDITVKVSATGTIEAEQQVVVKSKVAGRVVDLRVDEGDRVKAGDLIARVDPTEIRRQWNQIQADISAARAKVEQATVTKGLSDRTLLSQLDRAKAELNAMQSDYEKVKTGPRKEEIARAEAMLAQSQSKFEDADRNLKRQRDWVERGIARKQAEAELRASEANLARVKTGPRRQEITVAQAVVDRAIANRDEAKRLAERKRNLHKEGFTSDQDLDVAETQLKSAEQDVKSASEQLALLKEGSRVEDIRAAEAQAERARVVLDQTRENEKQSVESAQAQYDIARHARDSAKQDLALLKAGSRPEDIRSSEAQWRRAEASLREALARMDQSKVNAQDIASARAQVARLVEALGNISTQLEDTVVRTPMSGVVIHRALRKGELVTSGISSFTAGMEIVTIADLSSLIVKVKVNEIDVARLFVGQRAEVTVDAIPDETFEGRIKKIAPASIKPQTSQGQTTQGGASSEIVWFDVEIRLPNADKRLKPGMSANVDVVSERASNVPSIAREGIASQGRQHFVQKVTAPNVIQELNRREGQKDGAKSKAMTLTSEAAKADKIYVRLGVKDDQFAHVKSGLTVGDWVLIETPKGERQTFPLEKGKRR